MVSTKKLTTRMVLLMYDSILHFTKNGTEKIEKKIKEFLNTGTMSLGELVLGLGEPINELLCNIVSETIEEIDEAFRKDPLRKKEYHIIRKDQNCVLTSYGMITYDRTYFKHKESGERVYLADRAMGITANMRKSEDVTIKAIEHANDCSYRISGEKATFTDDEISKQAVMKELHKLEIPWRIPEVEEKKEARVLYITADEDHVPLQFNKEKGDLKISENGRKSNTLEPRLAVLYEGIRKESPKGKRNKLVAKYVFGGVYKNNLELWTEVREYIEAVYDEKYLEKIFIQGDGARWIKNGVDVLGSKCRFVLDEFHLQQSIHQGTRHTGDSVSDVKTAIRDAISFEDKNKIKDIFCRVKSAADTKSKKQEAEKAEAYILNQWNGIIIKNKDKDARMGSCAEGQVSHIFSTRLSRDPLGWSKEGADKMARLRVYTANGGSVIDLFRYKEEKAKRIIREEIQEKVDREIKGKARSYFDTHEYRTIATMTGKKTGMYEYMKLVRNTYIS